MRIFSLILIISIIFFSLTGAVHKIKREYLEKKYEKYQRLGPKFEIFWKIKDTPGPGDDKDKLHLALHVETAGWIGFGLAKFPTGGMGGSDILIGYVTDDTGCIEDRYAIGNAMPILDECQDWKLVASEEEEYNGTTFTTIEVNRRIKSKDLFQDNPVGVGNVEVIWAFGNTDTFGYHGLTNRMPVTVNFYDINEIDLSASGILTHDIRVSNYSGPIMRTWYGCQSFVLPVSNTTLYDIIAIEPLKATNNSIGVHHFNLVTCETSDAWFVNRSIIASSCSSPTPSKCLNNIYAAGSSNPRILYLPENVGYRMAEGYYKYVYLQIHYDNPSLIPWVDDTGVRIYYTANLRAHSAAGLVLGDVQIKGHDLPPQQQWIDRQYDCTSECLSRNNENMIVVGVFLHAHLAATQIYAYIRRTHPHNGNVDKIMIIRDQFFKFGWQFVGAIDPISIRPTDEIVVRCIYNTMDRQNATLMGLNSADEMCNVILFYYMEHNNKPNMSVCGYYRNRQTNETSTFCNAGFINQQNPQVVEPASESFRTWGNVTFNPYCDKHQSRNNHLEPELFERNLPPSQFGHHNHNNPH